MMQIPVLSDLEADVVIPSIATLKLKNGEV